MFRGRLTVWDPTMTSELNVAKKNRGKYGFNASHAEKCKHTKYNKDYVVPNGAFIPMGFENLGAWGDECYSFIREQFEIMEGDSQTWCKITGTIAKAIRRANTMYLDNIRGREVAVDDDV